MAQSSPSPSSWASSLHSKANTGGFRIPGPSTRFHKEHKQEVKPEPRPKYARFSSSVGSYDSPTARARSRLSMSPSNASTSSIPRPDGSHRKSSSQSSYMAQTAPLTPVRSPHTSAMNEYDSPFSDYFTDENRSIDDRAQYSTPSSESQRLLLRLNTLGAEILRQDLSGSATSDLEAKLDDLEAALSTPAPRSSTASSHLSESGLCISDAGEAQEPSSQTTPQQSTEQSDRPATPLPLDASADHIPVAVKARLRNQERLLKEAQDVLQRVSRANDSLRKRYEEIRQIHDSTVLELEEAAQEALILKSENESLKSDLGFDHSELLFMKLQLKALEVEADTLAQRLGDDTNLEQNKVLLNDDIEHWKADWDDVDARLRSRREKHLVVSNTPEKLSSAARDAPKSDHQGDWRLDMCKKRHGRFQSITIKRFNDAKDAEADEEEEEEEGEDDDLPDPTSIPKPPVFTPKYCTQSTQTEEPFMTPAEWEKMKEEAEALALLLGDPRERAVATIHEKEVQDGAEEANPDVSKDEFDVETEEDEDGEDESGEDDGEEDEDDDEDDKEGENDEENEQEEDEAEEAIDDGASLSSVESSPRRTAWQELYDSLTSFAGMDRD